MSEERESDFTKLQFSGRKQDWPVRGVPCIFFGYAKDHAPNVYLMLKLDSNAIIITRDIVHGDDKAEEIPS
jgi:hypothetical protein